MQEIAAWRAVDKSIFEEQIIPAGQPAIIRGLVTDWPAVSAASRSASDACRYLRDRDSGQLVYTIAAPPEAEGRFFYRKDLRSFNFKRAQIPLSQVLQNLLENQDSANPHSIAVQALSVADVLPDFVADNPLPLMEDDVLPTMWIGNRGRVSPHYDVHRNLACVVAGRREFTLFPPEQAENLYPGPVLDAPGGVPISLVDVQHPDLERFPRYETALAAAFRATLEPGDAIFIPSLWWHGVASLEPFNVLVNYWWGGYTETRVSPNDSLLHAMLSIAALDAPQRDAWRSYFDYYVFHRGEDPGEHLPPDLEDIVTSASDTQLAKVKRFLAARLEEN